jgi:threonine synthase
VKYYSLNHSSPVVNFKEAALRGQAPDKGLYFPEFIPQLEKSWLSDLKKYSKADIGFTVLKPYVGDTMPDDILYQIVQETIDFEFPVVPISSTISSLELYHGPTLAFKDVGARFMSRCLGYFANKQDGITTVLVATSGDTGGAVANGFLGVEGVEVILLYPSGKVSAVQELQLTTCGNNITALEVSGSFDDCQALVKQAFMDADLQKKLTLTSANSINVARWLPQQLYYFFALQQWAHEINPVIAVPSGNFGNLCAGILAKQSGLPIKHFIAACNSNDTVPSFLKTGHYNPQPAVSTISNAMDVAVPSNFVRIMELFAQQINELKNIMSGYTISDDATKQTIAEVYATHNYLLDPHGAVAYHALAQYLQNHSEQGGFILETAHPVKFPETVEKIIGMKIPIPASAQHLFAKEKQSILLPPTFEALKAFLSNR